MRNRDIMYNLNVNLAATAASAVNGLLAVESGGATPRTPEILNSLIAMTNPMDNYAFGDDAPKISSKPFNGSTSSDSNSSSSSTSGSPTNGPTSIQQTCSQLIKVGLKLSIEQKRKQQSDCDDILDLDKCKRVKKNDCSESEEDKITNVGLTPEDEERRRRRRERNKIAATKCRMKKRERTTNLIAESETLETQNVELKSQIQDLQNQRASLQDLLSTHRRTCAKNIPPVTREALFNKQNRLPPVSSVMETNHSYPRPVSVSKYKTSEIEAFNHNRSINMMCGSDDIDIFSSRSMYYTNPVKPPSIIIEPADTYQITTLDETGHYHSFNS